MAVTVTNVEVIAAYHRIFTISFFGAIITTTVTCAGYAANEWLEQTYESLLKIDNPVIGMGVQWFPGRGGSPAATLQLAFGYRCLIFQLAQCDYVPDLLRWLLHDPRPTFVGIWNSSDARRLEQCASKLIMKYPPLDLRKYVVTDDGKSLKQAPFEKIVRKCLGYKRVKMTVRICKSNWEENILSHNQVKQATIDAHASLLIGRDYLDLFN